jgi:predicted transcriptional regulator
MSNKETAIEMIRQMPEDLSFADIVDELFVHLDIEEGLRQLDNGEGLTIEEARKRLSRWVK